MPEENPERPPETDAVTVNLETIASVSIGNIIDLVDYKIVKQDRLTIHKGTFSDGGQFRLSYTDEGRLMEFKGQRIQVTVKYGRHVTLRKFPADATP